MELLDSDPTSGTGLARPAAPARPGGPGPVPAVEMLGGDDVSPVPDAPPRRPRWRIVTALLVALVTGAAAGAYTTSTHDAARTRNTAAAADRARVDLAPLHVSAHLDDDGELRVLVTLRNRGPKTLLVRGARLGGVPLSVGDGPVLPGQLWAGTGEQTDACEAHADVQGPLVLDVRTVDGADRRVELLPARDFLLQVDELPDPAACRSPGFESAYLQVDVVSSAKRGPGATRLVLSLTPQLPTGADTARLAGIGVDEPGVRTSLVAGLPVTLRTGEPARVTVDVSAPNCRAVKLPDDPTGGPYLWFRGRLLPRGRVATAPGYEANTVLVAVLRMLARACPDLVNG